MESPEIGLLRTIASNLYDAAPRLIYADWLEEHDDAERAALVRQYAESRRNPFRAGSIRVLAGTGVMGAIYDENRRRLLGPSRCFTHSGRATVMLRGAATCTVSAGRMCYDDRFRAYMNNGLVTKVVCFPDEWVTHGPTMVRQCPLQQVGVLGRKPYLSAVAPDPSRRWCWCQHIEFHQPTQRDSVIRRELFDHLNSPTPQPSGRLNGEMYYRSEAEALTALEAAAMKYALAGS